MDKPWIQRTEAVNYRTIADLNQIISHQLYKVPLSVDLIVGVPRSGLLAANILALKLNLPLTDVAGLCDGRLLHSGKREKRFQLEHIQHALVIDDSVCSGDSINEAKKQIETANLSFRVDYAAVYVAPGSQEYVDIFWEECPLPRVFEWNVMHHSVIENACVDIDGVICCDPNENENDDAERYLNFLRSAPPLVVPTGVIKTLVTCRLERYRHATEDWLASAGVHYDELVMLDLPDGESRRKWAKHGEYKGEIYQRSDAILFIESSVCEARKIADISAKPVLATDVNEMIYPRAIPLAKVATKRLPTFLANRLKKVKYTLMKRIHPHSY